MKRITALLTAVCLLLCLTACGEPAAQPEPLPTVTVSTTTAEQVTATTTTTATEEVTTVTDTEVASTAATSAVTEPTVTVLPTDTTTTRTTTATATTARPTTARSTTTVTAKPTKSATGSTIKSKTTTTRTTKTSAAEVEKKQLSILIIGNSHSVDAFWLLHQAYLDQNPDTELCLGILYYDGASIDEHVTFIENNEAVMRYYKNTGKKWVIKNGLTPVSVLTERPWDIVMMQPAKEDLGDETLNRDGRHALAEAVNRHLKTPHEFVWHVSWPSPNDETFFSPDYMRQPPKAYKDKLIRLYGFNPVTQFSVMTEMTRQWVVDDPLYAKTVCSGAPVMHALLTQGETQLELWRDYTHLSDYGRLLAAYGITAQLTGQPIKKVGIDVIPVKWRHHLLQERGDQTITAAMKQVIVKAVNHSLKDPWGIPPQNYPVSTLPSTTETTQSTTAATAG